MNFPSIDIQGSILSTDLLAKIRSEQATFQQGKDFHPDLTNAKLKDEISLAWQEAKGQWTIYKSKLTRLKEGETGTTETRNFWISPLLTNLGYNLTFNRQSEELNGKSFPIGYRDGNLDGFPVYVGGFHESLDKRPENKQLRVSPHAMVQEYLNYSEHLYGMVTNGRQLRLLRDASRITRLSYVEFNLEKMMEEDLYSDFVILYRVLHASRIPKKIDGGAESIIEKYHQEGLEAGSTIRSKLGDAVKEAIKSLANGFINHPNNTTLREAVASGNFSADEYYRHQLRIIYRLLFLFVIEERNLVYADNKTPEAKRFNQIYFNYYSLLRLRKLAKKLLPPEASRHYDLWQGLISTFSLFEKKEIGEKLGIMALQGDLFGYHAISGNGYDLHQCYLCNAVLLNIIKSLSYFENDNGILIAVNYGGLDVEEFGSVYEGLLELKLEVKKIEGSDQYSCSFDTSNERGKSGSHYTPEELVQPLIKHSLEYLIEDIIKPYQQKKASKETTIQSLLSLKIADVACGSGHILLSAARRLSLEIARVQTEEEQPNPVAIRKAMKDVVRNCIYGVDKNPLAVELCKIALWLEAYNPGEPLNFLDHHIKCGDAIVGLAHRSELENGIADEAFKTLPGDDKDIAASLRKRNQQERKQKDQASLNFEASINKEVNAVIEKFNLFKNLPETTPDEVAKKEREYRNFENSVERNRLKQLADAQVAQFFIPKTDATKTYLLTDSEYRGFLRNVHKGMGPLQSQKLSYVETLLLQYRFFHWFIEFPEVFSEGGFDCVLGNPPFLGDRRLKEAYGDEFLEWIRYNFTEGATVDLVVYFFLRINTILKVNGFQALISTNTVAQGKAREHGLEKLLSDSNINFAIKSMGWPGKAAVIVSLVSIFKGNWKREKVLNNKKASNIDSYLQDQSNINYYDLARNSDIAFQGSILLGDGFVITKQEANQLISTNSKNSDIIFNYLNGSDITDNPSGNSNLWVINFDSRDENEAKKYVECFEIIEKKVKPVRQRKKIDKNGNELNEFELRMPLPVRWWQHCEKRPKLYGKLRLMDRCIVIAKTSKHFAFCFTSLPKVIDQNLTVIALQDYSAFSIIQSNIHIEFANSNVTTMGNAPRYNPTYAFLPFPFPLDQSETNQGKLNKAGESYHEHRRQLMLGMQLGLTKTYNLFHSNAITAHAVNDKDKQVAALQKHLEKTANTISFNEAIQGILKLRELHVQMDEAVMEAYGWNDIALRHDFYEVDYLPENDRMRFTIHPDARKEVLKRLLELNHKIHEEEVKAGLWEKKKTLSKKVQKPTDKLQLSVFNNDTMKEWSLNDGIYSAQECATITKIPVARVRKWFKDLSKSNYEGINIANGVSDDKIRISFHGLIELVVIDTLRENGIKLKTILDARKELTVRFPKRQYPFATSDVDNKLKIAGSELIFEFPDGNVTLGKGQFNLEFITLFFKDIKFDTSGIARSFYPLSVNKPIIVDPKQADGKPAIDGKQVKVEAILQFYNGKETIPQLITQLGLTESEILAAVEYGETFELN